MGPYLVGRRAHAAGNGDARQRSGAAGSLAHRRGHGAGKRRVPGFPQDMWMPMDEMVEKPETYGLRKTWTAAMMGMMTLVRVLPPELYDKIMELKKQQPAEKKPAQPGGHVHEQK